MENIKMNFFTRIKKAIFKFDEYEKFVTEPVSKAIGYFAKIIIVFSLIITITLTYQMRREIKKVFEIIEKEFPEFAIKDYQLELKDTDSFEYYFEDLNLNIKFTENENNLQNINKENGLMLFKNKMVLNFNGFSKEILYRDAFEQDFSKEKMVAIGKTNELVKLLVSSAVVMFLISFIIYFVIVMIDVLTLAILGLIINMFLKTLFKFKDIFKISIYSMTLPLILYLIYMVLNILFGTTIKYFEIAYNSIAYIYLMTVLLMMKSDKIKNAQELQTLIEEQKKVREEIEREKQEEKEKQEEANRDKEKKKKEKTKEEPETEPQTEN